MLLFIFVGSGDFNSPIGIIFGAERQTLLMTKRIFIFGCLLMIGWQTVTAQSGAMGRTYKTALGVKFYPGAVSLKSFVRDNRAIEGLGSFWQWGGRITGLYEFHFDINNAPGLKWYVGPGAHIGFWNTKYKDRYRSSGSYFGIDGVLGLDYKINKAPLNISLDWQPSWNLGDYDLGGFDGGWGGFALRYTF
jgi:hypothetical protein